MKIKVIKKLAIVFTGGTIAMKASKRQGGAVPAPSMHLREESRIAIDELVDKCYNKLTNDTMKENRHESSGGPSYAGGADAIGA